MKLSVVIPAHNEAPCVSGTVEALYTTLRDASIPHEIIVVDDHSSDDTLATLESTKHRVPTLRVVSNSTERGFGMAVRCGLEHYTGDAVAIVMADGSDEPKDLVQYYRAFIDKKVDCVFGSRFISGSSVERYPFIKLVVNRIANTFIRVLFGLSYNDVTNAFKLFSRKAIDGCAPLLSMHFNLTVELPLKAIVRGYSFAVVPIHWRERRSGASKLKIKEMGSHYLFIVLTCLFEKWLSRGDTG